MEKVLRANLFFTALHLHQRLAAGLGGRFPVEGTTQGHHFRMRSLTSHGQSCLISCYRPNCPGLKLA